ncbi:hypothetical protein BOX15_Mlig028985g1 [Macrostomum lignano]|uniref:Protein kinase domain-containing protein n=1 Tax=Macrostomum lignano TaxID=282301 RepID=A0A267E478_9PLAT|nr:hypothetical protein BOX15_Mlig028985g1 [Macrostomum lignano]
MGNKLSSRDDGGGGSFHSPRQSSFRRLRRWASGLSLRSSGRGGVGGARTPTEPPSEEEQRRIARKWNRESRNRVHRSTLFDPFGSSKTKWPVPFIESLFLPDFRIRSGPEELEDLEVLDVIAAGSFGNVLKVRGDNDKKIYALKVIDKARLLQHGHAVVQQCKDEVGAQAAVGRSAFVASLLGHWQSRKRLYLLLEFFPNGELFALWKLHGQFSESLSRLYIAELACAIDYLHSCGVVFRDLKLENVVIDGLGHLVLIDFGLCKWLRRGQSTLTICGTLAYAAPEMLLGQPYDHSIDWWSLGILFYALVVGKFPLHGARHHRQMAAWVRRHEYEAPASLSWECRCTLERLLQKSPARRLASLPALCGSPFFKGRISFDMVQSRSLDPAAFHTQQDLSGRPADAEQHRLTQLRPVAFDPEDAVSRLIDESFLSDGPPPPPPQPAQPSAPWNQHTANGGAGTSRLI